MSLAIRPRSLVPLNRLHEVAEENHAHHAIWSPLVTGETEAIDHTRLFICPTLTPLYHTPSYARLSLRRQLRYNQLVAMSFNEVIAFFEESLAGTVLVGLSQDSRTPEDLRRNLAHFHAEEATHTALFRRLNQRAAPHWYTSRHDYLLRFSPMAQRTIRFFGRHARRFPFVFWVMLAMEERSLEISRRYANAANIEPHFSAIYQAHMKDESRHVQIDWHLIEQFYAPLPKRVRRLNARLLTGTIRRFLLSPKTAGRRVIDALIHEYPDLAPRRQEMLRDLVALEHHADYQSALFSPTATPILFRLMDRFPEFQHMQRLLIHYRPGIAREDLP